MKNKIFKAVSVVMLSAFLTLTAVPCSTEAAAGVDPETCAHFNVAELQVGGVSYPNAIESSHQVKVIYGKYCNDCHKNPGQVTRYYSESHTFGADRRCTKCDYYAH